MNKKIIIVTCILVLGIIIWVFFSNLRGWIAGYYTGFVQACRQLNGKELTYSNINSLHGNCYLTCDQNMSCVTVGKCEEKHLRQYKKLINKCGDPEINKLDAKLEDIKYDYTGQPVDPYYRCVDNFIKHDKSANLHINSEGTFSVSQDSLDGVWVCRISTINSKILAVPYFLDD